MDDRAILHRDLFAEHDIGLDHDVLAEFGVRAQKNRLRRNEGDAGVERGLAQALLGHRFRFGELALGVDAAHFILLDFDRDRVELHVARDGDRIGQIEFALAIVRADPLQDGQRLRPGERHDAAVAKIDGAFAGAGIGLLANGHELTAGDDQSAIACRIGRPESQHCHGGVCRQRRPQPRERRRANERRIAVNDQNIVRLPFDRGFCRQRRMCRSPPLVLHETLGAGQNAPRLRCDSLLPRPDDDGRRA